MSWHKLEDGYPDANGQAEEVIVATECGRVVVCMWRNKHWVEGDEFKFYFSDMVPVEGIYKVTHWRYLPAHPARL